MNITGVDEAGRGCVLGPLILASCTIPEDKIEYFKSLGIKDSKLLSIKKRKELEKIIKEKAIEYNINVITAAELNLLMEKHSLNEIEAIKVVEIILLLKKPFSKLILDCPDTSQEKFKKRIMSNLYKKFDKDKINFEVISEHKADFKYVSVACASILAKVTRDNLIESLVGYKLSGYSSDPKTIEYIKSYLLEHKKLPDFTRTKWKTVDRIFNELYQKKIGWFDESKK